MELIIFVLNYWGTTLKGHECFVDDGSSKGIDLIASRPNTKLQNEHMLSWNNTYLQKTKYADVFET